MFSAAEIDTVGRVQVQVQVLKAVLVLLLGNNLKRLLK